MMKRCSKTPRTYNNWAGSRKPNRILYYLDEKQKTTLYVIIYIPILLYTQLAYFEQCVVYGREIERVPHRQLWLLFLRATVSLRAYLIFI